MRNRKQTNSMRRSQGVALALRRMLIGLLFIRCSCLSQTLPPSLRQALARHLQASEGQLNKVEGGGVVAYVLDTRSREEIALVGIARIWAPPEAFLTQYRNIAAFEAGPGVMTSVKFSRPPRLGDIKDLNLTDQEANELELCRAGACGLKLGDTEIQYFRTSVNWTAPDYVHQADSAFRQLWLNYLDRYQKSGNSALMVYHDAPQYSNSAKELTELIGSDSMLREFSPGLADWLQDYPRSTLSLSDQFIYWQVGQFGLKPVHRISHVGIQRDAADFGDAYVIASKMLYASHFRSGLELRYAVPGQDQKVGAMHYLVTVQRSRVDGMQGFRGRFIRPIAIRRSRQALERHMSDVKRKVETAFNANNGQ